MEKTKWERIVEFNDIHFPNWREAVKVKYKKGTVLVPAPLHFSNALSGETGELCNIIKHYLGGGTKIVKTFYSTGFSFECVDVFVYLVLLMESMGITPEDFEKYFNEKMRILEQRMKTLERQ